MAHLSIIIEDKAVYKDQVSYSNLDLSSCNIPENVYALQWDGVTGEVEYKDNTPNDSITSLPNWANNAVAKWEEALANEPEPVDPAQLHANPGAKYSAEDFWNQYPEANVDSVNKLLNTKIEGITLGKAYKHLLNSGKLYGVETQSVTYGSLGLTGLQTLYNLAKQYGVASFSDRMYIYTDGLIEYLEQTGWNIYSGNDGENDYKIAYVTWEGDIVTNKAKEDINSNRTALLEAGYNDGTNVWDIDSQSMTNMTAKVAVVQDTDSVVWRTKDNNNVTMTGAEFKTLVAACVAAVDTIYQDSWTQKDNV